MALSILSILLLLNCGGDAPAISDDDNPKIVNGNNSDTETHLTTNDYVRDIVNHPAFNGFGELLLARDNNSSYYAVQGSPAWLR